MSCHGCVSSADCSSFGLLPSAFAFPVLQWTMHAAKASEIGSLNTLIRQLAPGSCRNNTLRPDELP